MKKLCSIVVLLAGALAISAAQEQIAGFIFINGTSLEHPVKFYASGKPLFIEDGLPAGLATSGLGLPVGEYKLTASAEGCQPAEMNFTIAPGKCPTIICYLKEVKNPQSGEVKRELAFLEFAHRPASDGEYILRFLYIPTDPGNPSQIPPIQGTIAGQPVTLKAFEPLELKPGKKVSFVTEAGQELETTDLEEPGAYYYLIFPGKDGGFASTVSQDKLYVW